MKKNFQELQRLEAERKALQSQLKEWANFKPLPIARPTQVYSLRRTAAPALPLRLAVQV